MKLSGKLTLALSIAFAGGAIVTAIVSILTGIPVRCDVAMTGEITLRGVVPEAV